MKKLFLLLFLSATLNVSATTNTNATVVSTRALTNMMRLMLDHRQFDTNVVPFAITNFAGITGGYEVTQFSTNDGVLTIVAGVVLTNVSLTGSTVIGHLLAGTNTITYNWGPAAGGTPTAGADSSTVLNGDTAFTIDVTPGGVNPTANANLVTNIFGSAYGRPPHLVVSPFNLNALTVPIYISSTTTTNAIFSVGAVTLTNGSRFKWQVHVIE